MRALVLDGNENQAVAATRSLARAGYRVSVGASERWSKAGWSRAASASFMYPHPGDDPDGFVKALVAELTQNGEAVVLPMTERSTIPVSSHRDAIMAAGGKLVLPPHEVLLRVFDKSWMTSLAESLGIAVPRSWVVDHATDVHAFAAALPYPVVLKPNVSQQRAEDGRSAPTGAPLYAKSVAEFTSAVAAMFTRCDSILIQEFVLGDGAGYFALMQHGDLRGEFAHRRIRDVRPTGSGSALRESVTPTAALRDGSLALLRAVGWHGVAMVEYRVRPDGTPVFLEVNGRFWNSLALAVHAGVDFPLGVAQLAEHGEAQHLASGIPGIRARWLLGDLRHLAAVLRGAPRGYPVKFPSRLATTVAVLSPSAGTRHDNFELGDPLPEFGDFIHFFGRKLPGALIGKLRGKRE